ncbi:MAG: D-alanyl-D-alanine carboxypeptidase/D-alanyl-D-alanine-endopeptidase [Ignavibacteriales bacterium]|nr:D-alanyl-D-alanine carboxypeptidase/D-alanyl-D-alanine-endopeptidase [Ignavibacteriales bacterium]
MKSAVRTTLLFFAIALCQQLGFAQSAAQKVTQGFRNELDTILNSPTFRATITGIKIVSLDNDEVLYERNASLLLRPASTTKLFTTSTALHVLGTSYSFATEMFTDSISNDGTTVRNLYFRGHGNPDFSSAELDSVILQLKSRGIRTISGNIVGDASFFDDKRWGNGWMWDDEPSGFAAYNSALTINRNCVRVVVSPGTTIGEPPIVTAEPPTAYVTMENTATTIADTSESSLEISRKYFDRSNTITVNGGLRLSSSGRKELITVLSPERYFLTLAKEALERDSINVHGAIALGSVPQGAVLLERHRQPIDSMMVFLNKESDNLSAENTLKTIGAAAFGAPGSTENGITAVKKVMAGWGIDSASFLQVDGSGVSHYNLIAPEAFVKLLTGMYRRRDIFDIFFFSLPIAGVDGTLGGRMKGTLAENNLHAKTGTISGVTTLSGYVRTQDSEMLAFSIMIQNFIGSPASFRDAQDAIGTAMASLKGRK